MGPAEIRQQRWSSRDNVGDAATATSERQRRSDGGFRATAQRRNVSGRSATAAARQWKSADRPLAASAIAAATPTHRCALTEMQRYHMGLSNTLGKIPKTAAIGIGFPEPLCQHYADGQYGPSQPATRGMILELLQFVPQTSEDNFS